MAPEWLVSVDDHVVEPPDLWVRRVPARCRDAAPWVFDDGLGEAWHFENRRIPIGGNLVVAGRDQFTPEPVPFAEMDPSCYDAAARVATMNADHVLASLCFPTFGRFCGQLFTEFKDRDLALACIQAYNDWHLDEWSGSAPGRFIPAIILPLWNAELSAAEIDRCAANGAHAVLFSENPAALGLPSIHDPDRTWDPVFARCQEIGLPLCCHIGSSSKIITTSDDMPNIVMMTVTLLNSAIALCDWMFSTSIDRFRELKICLSEGGIGWIPWLLERADHTLDRQRGWVEQGDYQMEILEGRFKLIEGSGRTFDRTPTEIFREQFFGCFIDDPFGAAAIDRIGVDNVMIETDYPHSDCNWPHSLDVALGQLTGRSDEDIEKVLLANACRVFHFEPALADAPAGD